MDAISSRNTGRGRVVAGEGRGGRFATRPRLRETWSSREIEVAAYPPITRW